MAPNAKLAGEKAKCWYDFLHNARTVHEGVEFLTDASTQTEKSDVKDSGQAKKKKKKKKKKAKQPESDAEVGALSSLSAA